MYQTLALFESVYCFVRAFHPFFPSVSRLLLCSCTSILLFRVSVVFVQIIIAAVHHSALYFAQQKRGSGAVDKSIHPDSFHQSQNVFIKETSTCILLTVWGFLDFGRGKKACMCFPSPWFKVLIYISLMLFLSF